MTPRTICSMFWSCTSRALPPGGFQRSMATASPTTRRVTRLPIAPPIAVIQRSRRSSGVHLNPVEIFVSLPCWAGLIQISLGSRFSMPGSVGRQVTYSVAAAMTRRSRQETPSTRAARILLEIRCAPFHSMVEAAHSFTWQVLARGVHTGALCYFYFHSCGGYN